MTTKAELVRKPKGARHYYFQFSVPGMPRFRGNTHCADKAEAQAFAQAYRARELAKATLLDDCRGTNPMKPRDAKLALVVDHYWTHHGLTLKNADELQPVLYRLLDWLGPETMMTRVDDGALLAFRAMLLDKTIPSRAKPGRSIPSEVRRYKPGSINSYLRQIRAIHNHARTSLKLPLDPIDWKKLWLREGKQRTREITIEEEDAMFSGSSGYALAGRFSVMSGFRKMNFTELRWSEVNFQSGMISLEMTKVDDRPYTIPLTGGMCELLQAQVGNHPIFVFTYVCRSTRPNPRTGKREIRGERRPLTYAGYTSWFKRRAKKLGYNITPHDSRRSAGGRILDQTGSLALVQSVLNLSSVDIARKRYAHTKDRSVLAAMEATELASVAKRRNVDQIRSA